MKLSVLLLSIAATTLTGCASWFNTNPETVCPGGTGVPCTSLRNAYQLSNHTTNFDGPEGKNIGPMADAPVKAISVSLPEPIAQPMPVMEPAKVARIWVNKWVDDTGNLHYPSLVFTEVTPRKWAEGSNSTVPGKIVTAYRIEPNPSTTAALVSSTGTSPLPKAQASPQQPAPATGQTQAAPLQLPVKPN